MTDKTELEGRVLYVDGVSEVKAEDLPKLLAAGVSLGSLCVDRLTPDIVAYNRISEHKLEVGHVVAKQFPPEWSLPDAYMSLDLETYVLSLVNRIQRDELYDKRIERLAQEISLFEREGYNDILRALIYVIDELKKANIVWGVGRGSSCSSYLLYLIGLHEVDAVKYDIDISDFIK